MRKLVTLSLLALIGLTAFKTKLAEEKFTVDTEKSTINWSAKKVGGGHVGTVKISSGSIVYDGNNLKSGSFVMDMPSLTVEGGANLLNHLKGDDFFGVAKHPTSTFAITKIAPAGADQVNVTGNLTIKGITNPVTFPATVKKQGNVVVAVANNIKIDRTKYDIKFRSASFFSSIGNQAIDDVFELSVNVVARK